MPIIKVACKILQITKNEQSLFFTKSSNLSPILTNFYHLSLKKYYFSTFFALTIFKEIQSGTKIWIFVGIKYNLIYDIVRSYYTQIKVIWKSNIMRGGKILIDLIFLTFRDRSHSMKLSKVGEGVSKSFFFNFGGGRGFEQWLCNQK